MQALRAHAHRRGVRDRAALERDEPIKHGNDAARAGLRTADAASAAAIGANPVRRTPAPNAHRPNSHRRPAIARTAAPVLDIATASNSAVPLLMSSTPPLSCARAHRTAARAPQSPLRRIEQRTRSPPSSHHTTRALRDGRAPMIRTDARCNAHIKCHQRCVACPPRRIHCRA